MENKSIYAISGKTEHELYQRLPYQQKWEHSAFPGKIFQFKHDQVSTMMDKRKLKE